ncbi:MAG TPA: hypothetical protein VF163_00915 [Micromonosporaceae bacterium]
MKHKGPIITLAAGLVVAAVLMVMNLSVTPAGDRPGADTADAAASAPTTTAPTTAATRPPAAAAQVTYAGKVDGGAATIAIAVKDGRAVAYLCDGRAAEAWLQGTADNGELDLAGAGNARLSGTFANGVATGRVTAAGRTFDFSVGVVKPPSGLYRASANVRNAKVVGGWIVVNGEQVGLLVVDGTARPAPPLDPTTGRITVDGTAITAAAVDGAGL